MEEFLAAAKFASMGMDSGGGGEFSGWAGTFTALGLLLLNRLDRRSAMQTNLLVLYLCARMPTALFKLLRGQFGCWVAFLAIGANLLLPRTFPASRFILFVVMPGWLVDELRGTMAGFFFSLVITGLILVEQIMGIASVENFHCKINFIISFVAIGFLFFFIAL